MRNTTLWVLTWLIVLSTVLAAADVTGKWTALVPGRDGTPREQVFQLKAVGDKLTGTVGSGRSGTSPIADGSVSGDSVSFTLTREFNGNTVKWTYTGTLSGEEIKFKRTGGQGEPREFTAKRAH